MNLACLAILSKRLLDESIGSENFLPKTLFSLSRFLFWVLVDRFLEFFRTLLFEFLFSLLQALIFDKFDFRNFRLFLDFFIFCLFSTISNVFRWFVVFSESSRSGLASRIVARKIVTSKKFIKIFIFSVCKNKWASGGERFFKTSRKHPNNLFLEANVSREYLK